METRKEINNSKFSVEEIIEVQLLKVVKEYDVLDGLCFSISKELGENLINFFKEENKDELDKLGRAPTILKYKLVHGELGFSLDVPSSFWGIQHTWLEVEIYSLTISVDATMKQFKDIIEDIPDYYISRDTSPKWYLKDKSNLKLNKYIIHTKLYDVISWWQYEVVGKIYDFIGKLKKEKESNK